MLTQRLPTRTVGNADGNGGYRMAARRRCDPKFAMSVHLFSNHYGWPLTIVVLHVGGSRFGVNRSTNRWRPNGPASDLHAGKPDGAQTSSVMIVPDAPCHSRNTRKFVSDVAIFSLLAPSCQMRFSQLHFIGTECCQC
ncbi:hypothetical protein KCP78_19275 [Salmonella enterica subsp. enterica]|nr:hypothetical protein KCP78_19275 [Salmonella enterica subsp. enterica]